ncbi:MAG: bifunctional oligoribonuclease/PAP phosphatase NrnA [Phycisphaerae bacterium]
MTAASLPSIAPAEICAALRGAKNVALIGHVTPDADCLGSLGGLWLALPELGVRPHAALPDGTVSRKLEFLVQHAGMKPASAAELRECDLALVVDTAKDRRVNLDGKLESIPRAAVLNVDHHETNTRFGKWNWVVPHASSSAELVFELLTALGCQITPTVATLLYAGLHADTQGFSLSNTTPRSLQVGYELAARGARVREVCERLHRSHSRSEFDLLKIVYANTRVTPDGRLAWSTVSHDEIVAAGCNANDIDDQVEVPRSVEGALVAILFSEGHRGKIRMNFRGESGVSVLPLAAQFGGGGHNASAGAILDGTIHEVSERVIAAAREFAAGLPPLD